MFSDLMLDLETLGCSPGAVIVQIGACYFDKETGEIGDEFCMNIDARHAVECGFKIDVDTVLWWLDQSKAAQDSVFKKAGSIDTALHQFRDFARNAEFVWCHVNFDFSLLMAAYSLMNIERPFDHRSARDLRTLVDLAKMNGQLKDRPRVGIHHNALDDCLFQVGYTVEAMQKLKG